MATIVFIGCRNEDDTEVTTSTIHIGALLSSDGIPNRVLTLTVVATEINNAGELLDGRYQLVFDMREHRSDKDTAVAAA